MTNAKAQELIMLLEERKLSNFERRQRRLQAIPLTVVTEAFKQADRGLPLTAEQYAALNLGFLPGERETLEERMTDSPQ